MNKRNIVLSADIGGTHITTALIDLDQRQLIPGSMHRVKVDAQGSCSAIISSWCDTMRQSMQQVPEVHGVGIAMPGPFDYEQGICLIKDLHKYDALYGMNVKALLAERLQLGRIHMANDARCFLQGELFNGSAIRTGTVMGFTIGTGFGAAVEENGMAMDAYYYDYPFLNATAEDYFSARWFIKRYEELSGKHIINVKELALLASNEPVAVAVFEEFGKNLASFFQLLEPRPASIILGGNIAQTFSLFNPPMQRKMRELGITIHISLSALGELATLLGAASLFSE